VEKLCKAPKPTASSRNKAKPIIEIADGSGVVKKKKGFGNKGAADAWIAARKPAGAISRLRPHSPRQAMTKRLDLHRTARERGIEKWPTVCLAIAANKTAKGKGWSWLRRCANGVSVCASEASAAGYRPKAFRQLDCDPNAKR
jgi:hypothetical protein